MGLPNWLLRQVEDFEPFMFVMVMGTGISSNLLYEFPYEAHWLRRCSYVMFGLVCLVFLWVHSLFMAHMALMIKRLGFKGYFNRFFRDLQHTVFWGMYPIGFDTIINYFVNLAMNEAAGTPHSRRLVLAAYILWWYDVLLSLFSAWGITFFIWQKYYFVEGLGNHKSYADKVIAQQLKSMLLLPIIPLVVAASSSGIFTMSDIFTTTFNRNIQLLTLVITTLMWFHSMALVFFVITIYVWSLYVNKIPQMQQVFTMFLTLGPLGQGTLGILLITNNVKKYVDRYYSVGGLATENGILVTTIPWVFKIVGLLISMLLLSLGYFFTFVCFTAIVSYRKTSVPKITPKRTTKQRIYTFHKGWWAMTFPMGTMSLGSTEVFIQYNKYAPLSAFRVVGTIYATICILWTLTCFFGTVFPFLRNMIKLMTVRNAPLKKTESESTGSSLVADALKMNDEP